MRIGVIHGRFQMLHLGHMEYLLAGKSKCDFLYIGISNPDPDLSAVNDNDLKRTDLSANPFTYFERLEMIRDAMIESGIKREEFEIVPFPINYPQLIKYYVPLSATFFLTVYDNWGIHKLNTLRDLGVSTDLMWTRTMEERFSSGKDVRSLIANGMKWEHLVPKSTAQYVYKNKLTERIIELCKK